jgi:predicted  nucleic acid-binding Zn-ribbon protein
VEELEQTFNALQEEVSLLKDEIQSRQQMFSQIEEKSQCQKLSAASKMNAFQGEIALLRQQMGTIRGQLALML